VNSSPERLELPSPSEHTEWSEEHAEPNQTVLSSQAKMPRSSAVNEIFSHSLPGQRVETTLTEKSLLESSAVSDLCSSAAAQPDAWGSACLLAHHACTRSVRRLACARSEGWKEAESKRPLERADAPSAPLRGSLCRRSQSAATAGPHRRRISSAKNWSTTVGVCVHFMLDAGVGETVPI
jgi:hypothetical protein